MHPTRSSGVIVVTRISSHFRTHAPLVIIDPNNEAPDFPAVIATNREGALAVRRLPIANE
jgi:hypothetical protein